MATLTTQTGGRLAQSDDAGRARAQPIARSTRLASAALLGLSLWAGCMGSLIALSNLAAGSAPALSLALGMPLAVAGMVLIALRRVRGALDTGTWRSVILTGICLLFPVATPHYFDLCAKVGLFLGRVPGIQPIALLHALLFFGLPSLIFGVILARTCGSRWMFIGAITAGLATMAQVSWCSHINYDHPLLQLWVWNAVILAAACVACVAEMHRSIPSKG